MSDAGSLTIEDKKVIVGVLIDLRAAGAIGLLEMRRWIEKLFPEFATIRDTELDEYLREVASQTASLTSQPSGEDKESVSE